MVDDKEKAHVVWKWDEFQAFAKRMGIDTEMPTRSLSITFDFAELDLVTVEHEFFAMDKSRLVSE